MIEEIRLGLQRFWRLRWFVKWPIIIFLGFMVLAIATAPFSDEDGDNGDSGEAARQESSEHVTSGALGDELRVEAPAPGAIVACPQVTITGVAPAGAKIRREGSDDEFAADALGRWAYTTRLDDGEHLIEFFLVDSDKTRTSITLTHDKSTAVPLLEITSPSEGALMYDGVILIEGTAPPGCEVKLERSGDDKEVWASADGTWSMELRLDDGEHALEFFLQQHKDTRRHLNFRIDTRLSPGAPAPVVQINEPVMGAEICSINNIVTFRGIATPGFIVQAADAEVTASSDGQWALDVPLEEGENKLEFELKDYDYARASVTVTYCLPLNADKAAGIIVMLNEIADPVIGDGFLCDPEPGNRLVAINVTVINTTSEQQQVADFLFELRDGAGVQWDSFYATCVSPQLGTLYLQPGGQISGWISYEIRAESELTELYYDPNAFDGDDIHIATQ